MSVSFLLKRVGFSVGIMMLPFVVATSSAQAMSVGQVGDVVESSRLSDLLRVSANDQHRIYPGSEDAEAKRARAAKKSLNTFCEKQQTRCE